MWIFLKNWEVREVDNSRQRDMYTNMTKQELVGGHKAALAGWLKQW